MMEESIMITDIQIQEQALSGFKYSFQYKAQRYKLFITCGLWDLSKLTCERYSDFNSWKHCQDLTQPLVH